MDRHIRTEPTCLKLHDVNDCTPLLLASRHGNVTCMKAFIDKGASVETETESNFGHTSTMVAAKAGQLPTLQLALDHNAVPTEVDREGMRKGS